MVLSAVIVALDIVVSIIISLIICSPLLSFSTRNTILPCLDGMLLVFFFSAAIKRHFILRNITFYRFSVKIAGEKYRTKADITKGS